MFGERRRFAMAVSLREDFDASRLRGLAKKAKDGPQARRLLALAAIYDGSTRTEAAKIGGVGLQIIRDWVLRFNARGPDGLLNGKAPGQPSKLNDAQRQAIAQLIERGPIPAIHGVVRWRLIDLAQWIFAEFRDHDRQADVEPRTAGDGLPQTVGSATSSCAGGGCD
jgi:transposase